MTAKLNGNVDLLANAMRKVFMEAVEGVVEPLTDQVKTVRTEINDIRAKGDENENTQRQQQLQVRGMNLPVDNMPVEVAITYEQKDGWHLFTCDRMKGLFVASPDLRMAYDDVPTAVRDLLKLDCNVECDVEWKLTYAGFRQSLNSSELTHREDIVERARTAVRQRTQELMSQAFPPVLIGSRLNDQVPA